MTDADDKMREAARLIASVGYSADELAERLKAQASAWGASAAEWMRRFP